MKQFSDQTNLLWKLSATQMVKLLHTQAITPMDALDAMEYRIQDIDNLVNATPIVDFESARREARNLMETGFPENPPLGYLYGLPILVKDLTPVKGLRFTMGSLMFENHISEEDGPLVTQLRKKGAIIVGKTNTPEFGAGAQTFNQVFGSTRNPWNLLMTSGGSSGGSAAALSSGESWLCTGSDLGGSLRIPASFCGVVGMRCSTGRIPHPLPNNKTQVDQITFVEGPMARNVQDTALFLDAMVQQNTSPGFRLDPPEISYQQSIVDVEISKFSIAFSLDLGGVVRVDSEVAEVFKSAVKWFQQSNAIVEQDSPDLRAVPAVFHVLRCEVFWQHPILSSKTIDRSKLSYELQWQLSQADNTSTRQVEEARAKRADIIQSVRKFFEKYDVLVTPTVICPPFDANKRYQDEVAGVHFDNAIEWFMMTCIISLIDCPCISIPCGYTSTGLPVGLQIIGDQGRENIVLQVARAFEQEHEFCDKISLI